MLLVRPLYCASLLLAPALLCAGSSALCAQHNLALSSQDLDAAASDADYARLLRWSEPSVLSDTRDTVVLSDHSEQVKQAQRRKDAHPLPRIVYESQLALEDLPLAEAVQVATAYRLRAEHQDAVLAYRRVLALSDNPKHLYFLALSLRAIGNSEGAERVMSEYELALVENAEHTAKTIDRETWLAGLLEEVEQEREASSADDGKVIAGFVRSREAMQPIHGAQVEIVDRSHGRRYTLYTNEDGIFSLAELAGDAELLITVSAQGHHPRTLTSSSTGEASAPWTIVGVELEKLEVEGRAVRDVVALD